MGMRGGSDYSVMGYVSVFHLLILPRSYRVCTVFVAVVVSITAFEVEATPLSVSIATAASEKNCANESFMAANGAGALAELAPCSGAAMPVSQYGPTTASHAPMMPAVRTQVETSRIFLRTCSGFFCRR